jgi:hypothetical protein
MIGMGRISAILPDELEKELRLKTLLIFGGRKGDLSRAVEEAVKAWVATKNNSKDNPLE